MESIDEENGSGSGYLKVLIPRSEKIPHRAMLANREYFRRSTEGFYRMEHFDLEDAFGRRPRPSLKLILELQPSAGEDPNEDLRVLMCNEGRGIAKHVGLTCEFGPEVKIVAVGRNWENNTDRNQGRPIVSYADNSSVMHPVPVSFILGSVVFQRAAKGAPLAINVRWYCEGMGERTFSGVIEPPKENSP